MKHLDHNFKFFRIHSADGNYLKCEACNIVVFTVNSKPDVLEVSDYYNPNIKYNGKLLTCSEYIIKNILE